MSYAKLRRRRRVRRVRRDRRRVPRAWSGLRRRRRDAVAPIDRHHRYGTDHAAVVVAADRSRRDHRAARGGVAAPAQRASSGALDAQGAPGVRRQDAPRGRRTAGGRPRACRAHRPAHRGRACRRATGTAGDGVRRGRRRRLRHETEDFLDQRLGSFEILLDKLQKTVGAGRQRLSIGSVPMPANEAEEDDPTKGFFDQDQ